MKLPDIKLPAALSADKQEPMESDTRPLQIPRGDFMPTDWDDEWFDGVNDAWGIDAY